ncbi:MULTISPECIES: pseudouridine synthase [unclassified Arsukibacterium]|uniref:pseudouridine synthase n=1 Tax=unclassified Arsukibacterium TaxID=2635278 RepID=UPI000C8BF838|nr:MULTISPECIES: RluA family pseudouridine synthase [unclassified Arsukibacterium]MAA96514.1 RNA pseudouridine synthase [Rheinheimera sp.]HAW94215.1 RNA pseudouridine synthase [Candidatus Azambacteria bacterium]|tara:strand:- start:25446 stop:26114 length:669 start_codon:yes stop_codon:yes gene_type:complete
MTDLSELAVLPATEQPFTLLFEDEQLLVVSKPTKLLTVPGRHPANKDCLISRVQREWPTASVVHRLDYDTSGIVLLPLTKRALSELSKQFQARSISKQYQAVVAGLVEKTQGEINLPIAADPENRPLYKICKSGKASVSHFQVVERDSMRQQSRLLLMPVTGRSHQLRLHTRAIGHPILGDTLYGTPDNIAQAGRLLLHACNISFIHPFTAEQMSLTNPAEF